MKKIIGIISGDPNSINSEIIAKSWKSRKNFKNTNIFVIGNFNLIKKQMLRIGYNIKLKKINQLNSQNFKKDLCIYDVPLKFKNLFNIKLKDKERYIKNSFKIALNLIKKKRILGLINCPVSKKDLSNKKKFKGITEFLAKKNGVLGKEVMLIYNKSLSVSPITTHIKISSVSKNISKEKIETKIRIIDNFFKQTLKIRPKIGILGLNPHNDEMRSDSEEKKIILPAINNLKRKRILIEGPLSTDTAFLDYKKKGFNVVVGMYHDQVLTTFKALFKFNAINITLGLPFLRVSPDHGVGRDIIKKNKASPKSLIDCINFFKKINASS